MIIEMRDAAYDKAFELVDKAKHYSKKQKMLLCALEDTLYECYEASQENDEDEYEGGDEYEPEAGEYNENESDISFRSSRSGMRNGMRSGMHYGESMMMRRNRRGMRRDRMGRYSY